MDPKKVVCRGARTWCAVMVLLMAGAVALAAAEPPEVLWGPSAVTVPGDLVAGYAVFTVESGPEHGDTMTVLRLAEGADLVTLRAALARIDEAFTEGGDAVAAINEALELATVVGEVGTEAPGGRRSVGIVLQPGRYVLERTPGSEGPAVRSYEAFSVAEGVGASPPEPDVRVLFVDFAFALPPDIPAGPTTWHVTNVGQQIHHMVVFRLAKGATMDEFRAWMEVGPPDETAPPSDPPADVEAEMPAAPADYVGILSPAEESYHFLDLEEGRYVAVCFLPDHRGEETGMPHFLLGMMQEFSVGL